MKPYYQISWVPANHGKDFLTWSSYKPKYRTLLTAIKHRNKKCRSTFGLIHRIDYVKADGYLDQNFNNNERPLYEKKSIVCLKEVNK
tara:strand:- start:899 stop:1159 length:261 start_codon:yes stop_codon:yes gene_type:complete